MPRIPDSMLNSTIYLYPTIEDAQSGKSFGGTGFLVGVPASIRGDYVHTYIVSNWHVVCRDGSSIARVNTLAGSCQIIDYGPEDWTFDHRFDLAAVPVSLDNSVHDYKIMDIRGFLTREHIENNNIGVGDDVFMVGRFIDHDGGVRNRPAVRFGAISVMPSPIIQPNGRKAESFCVDLHSRTGYSGSPVFIYRTPGSDLNVQLDANNPRFLLAGSSLLLFLGLHWGQFPELWEVSEGLTAEAAKEAALITAGSYVKGLSGMTCVLPAWNIIDLLNSNEFLQQRAATEAAFLAKLGADASTHSDGETNRTT